jgi:hypothetical protein
MSGQCPEKVDEFASLQLAASMVEILCKYSQIHFGCRPGLDMMRQTYAGVHHERYSGTA